MKLFQMDLAARMQINGIMVERETMLYDECRVFQSIDEKDLESYVVVADYIGALKWQ